jgi:Leucine-rich repeat (LRR) protein
MWGGILVAAASSICWWLRSLPDSPFTTRLYRALLIAAIILVSFTGYRGGQLAHGETHLTEFLPSRLQSLLGPSTSENSVVSVKDPSSFYDVRIQPLFEGHCITCHGQSKHKAGLRLDSYALVIRGGKHGPVIKPGDLKGSELVRRITLPQSDDDFMPADNKRPLSASAVTLIETWISEGASRTLRAEVLAALPGNASTETTVREVTFPAADPAAVARERAAVAPVLGPVQLRLPNVVEYESRTSANLVVNASWRGAKFGDDQLAELAALSQWIVTADFSGTAITDRSARVIAAMKKLRHLRLAHTAITDSTIESLGSLDELESLSVFDTRVTESSLSVFTHLAKLRKVYAGGTKIPQGSAMPSPVREKLIF